MNLFETDLDLCRAQILELRKYTKRMNILLVEDYLVLQKSLQKIFSSLFDEVDVASDGVEALELYMKKRAQESKYDIIFSDIAMPNMDGVGLTKKIKELDVKQIMVIFSAYQDSNYLLELINLDVRRFILKPITLRNLLDELLFTCRGIYNEQNLSNNIILGKNIIYRKDEKNLYVDDLHVKLTKSEQLIFELFITKINQTISNDDIVNYLYASCIEVEFDNVRKMVYKLRKKVPKDLIQNIHSIGYRVTNYAC